METYLVPYINAREVQNDDGSKELELWRPRSPPELPGTDSEPEGEISYRIKEHVISDDSDEVCQ